MFLESVVLQVVVQEREVIVKCDWPTANSGGRVFVKLLVVGEVVQDLVVIGLRIVTGTSAVPEYQLLFGPVAQPQVCHVEVDFFEKAPAALTFD